MCKSLIRLLVLMLCLVPAMAYAQDASSDAPKVIVLKSAPAADIDPAADTQSQPAESTPPVITLRKATTDVDNAEPASQSVADVDQTAQFQDPGQNDPMEQAMDQEQANQNNWSWTGDDAEVNNQEHADDEEWVWADHEGDDFYTAGEKESVILGHGLQLGMSFIGIPGSIFGAWFDKYGKMWDGVANMGFSLDYTMRFKFPMELRLSLSWANLRTGNGYWLKSENAEYPELADYIVSSLSTVAIEAAVYHMIPIIDNISFYYGGGLWGGVVMGDLNAYAIDHECAVYSNSFGDIDQCSHSPSSHSVKGVPPVLGSLIVTLGFKFTVFDRMTIRTEGGFKGYFYGQLGVGIEF